MISARKLSNGVNIVMEEMRHVNSVSCGIWVKTGSCDEDKKISGISHFVEHMMFKGTPERNAFRISADVEKLGASMNAFTGKEATCFYIKAMSENYLRACDVMCDMLENALFDSDEMDRERHVIEEEIKMSKDDPEDFCHDMLGDGIFKGTSMSNSILGTASSIRRINHRIMADYVDRQYTRDSICVSVAGNFDPEEVCAYFENRFMNRGATKEPREELKPVYEQFTRSATRDISQAHVCLGTKAFPLADERTYTIQILNGILGGNMSSRLFQSIREKKGLAYTVFSAFSAYSSGGYFEIYAGVSMENVGKAIAGIKEEIEKFACESAGEDELESAKTQMKAIYAFSQESTSARMLVNGKNYLLVGRYYTPDEVMDGFNSVSIGDIDDMKETICDFSGYSATVVSGRRTDIKGIMKRIAG